MATIDEVRENIEERARALHKRGVPTPHFKLVVALLDEHEVGSNYDADCDCVECKAYRRVERLIEEM